MINLVSQHPTLWSKHHNDGDAAGSHLVLLYPVLLYPVLLYVFGVNEQI